MLVVEINWTGPEILLRLMEPELNRTCPSPRYGMGADTSGRLLRLVNARVRVDMMDSVDVFVSLYSGYARRQLAFFVDSSQFSDKDSVILWAPDFCHLFVI